VICDWLGFPGSESACGILKKCAHPFDISALLYLRDALTGPDARLVAKALSHVPRINASVLRLVTDPRLMAYTTANLLAEISDIQETRPAAGYMLRDVLRLAELMIVKVPPIKSSAELLALHEAMIEKYQQFDFDSGIDLTFPSPPLLGNEIIRPIRDRASLIAWGATQKNCIPQCVHSVFDGTMYFYSARIAGSAKKKVGRYTISVARSFRKKRWSFGSIKGACNREPSRHASEVALQWFAAARRRQARK
jgi:hypothetical protein